MSLRFSSNSEADTSVLRENIVEMFPRHYMHSDGRFQCAIAQLCVIFLYTAKCFVMVVSPNSFHCMDIFLRVEKELQFYIKKTPTQTL